MVSFVPCVNVFVRNMVLVMSKTSLESLRYVHYFMDECLILRNIRIVIKEFVDYFDYVSGLHFHSLLPYLSKSMYSSNGSFGSTSSASDAVDSVRVSMAKVQ